MTLSRGKILKAAGILAVVGLFSSIAAARITAQSIPESGQSRSLPVRTTEVALEHGYHAKRTFTGRAVPGRISQMAFELGGSVSAIHVDLGAEVQKGDTLAVLDTARLEAQRAQLLAEREEVKARLDLAERTLGRAQETYSQGHSSAQRLDEAEANAISLRANEKRLEAAIDALDVDLEKSRITAPFDGIITARFLDEGTVVGAGTAILEVSENNRMEAISACRNSMRKPPNQAPRLSCAMAAAMPSKARRCARSCPPLRGRPAP